MMYNVFDDCEEYEVIRAAVLAFLAGEEEADPEELKERTQALFDEDRITGKQYDNLMLMLGCE